MDDFARCTVLLVEPHQLVRRIMRDILRVMGVAGTHVVDTVENAYAWLKENHADVAFVDWSSSTDALALMRLLRADDSPNPYMPVVVISAYGDRDHVRLARDAGVNEYMLKPFSPQTVVKRMRSVVEQPRMFVKSGQFFGPDRRRHRSLDFPGPERRHEARFIDRRFHVQPFTGTDRRQLRQPRPARQSPRSPSDTRPATH